MTVRVVTNHPDQPWKIARMNKFTYALALGAGLVLSLAAPTVHADPIVQTLTPATLSAAQFNTDFTPTTGVLTNSYTFMNTPTTGVVESQVFQGTGMYAGLTAYAYQFGVNNVADSTGQPTSVNSASMQFNATPVPVEPDRRFELLGLRRDRRPGRRHQRAAGGPGQHGAGPGLHRLAARDDAPAR